MSETTTRRTIITEYDSLRHGLTVAADAIHDGGLVVQVPTVAEAETDTDEALGALKAQIHNLEPIIGWPAMDALLSGLNAAMLKLRDEAVARLITAAVQTLDYAQGVFVPPEGVTHRHSTS